MPSPDRHDQHYIQHELARYKHLFDTLEPSPLTQEQRIAAVTMAARNVVIAAAGSGKTSTMVGKVAYALCSGMYRADQILVLAFNRKAAIELDVRLRKRLAPFVSSGTQVAAHTLHALGLDIVSRVKGYRPQVQGADKGLLSKVLRRLVHHDLDFAEHWLLFRVFYHVEVHHPDEFKSRKQWSTFVKKHGERYNRRYGFLTLCDELVPTQFEQAVGNWLYLHEIDYLYVPLTHRAHVSMWLGVNIFPVLSAQTGFFLPGLKKYVMCVAAETRSSCRARNAVCITVEEFRAGTVFSSLRKRLCPERMSLEPRRMKTVLSRLGHRLTPGQIEFLSRFIRIARLGRVGSETIEDRVSRSLDQSRAALHAPMLAQLLAAYDVVLNEADAIDFEGMLHHAADCLEQRQYTHPYRLVLVDEFQDTSQAGIRLIRSLLSQQSDCKLFAVGDDWQSIYRFAGAVPDVLSHFDQYFGCSVVNYLTATFRFNQSIADLASRFIQVNPLQLRKAVRARPSGYHASMLVARYASTPHMFALCQTCLGDSVALHSRQWDRSDDLTSVYILGRYQHQRPPQLDQWRKQFPQLDIEYQTVHSAKGLEADIVILLGLHDGRYGFPTQVPNEPLMDLVMPDPEDFPYAEERRLFYVALTRSRHRVYMLTDIHQPSTFVAELVHLAGVTQDNDSDMQFSPFQKLC